MNRCATPNCERSVRDGFRWCDDCTAVVLRTGRPPVIPEKFIPPWLKNLRAKEMRDAA